MPFIFLVLFYLSSASAESLSIYSYLKSIADNVSSKVEEVKGAIAREQQKDQDKKEFEALSRNFSKEEIFNQQIEVFTKNEAYLNKGYDRYSAIAGAEKHRELMRQRQILDRVKNKPILPKNFELGNMSTFRSLGDLFKLSPPSKENFFDVYQMDGQNILYLNFGTQAAMALTLSRLYDFVESPENHGKIHNSATLVSASGHDYRLQDIARFYTEADKVKAKLNPFEIYFRDQLIKNNLIAKKGTDYVETQSIAIVGATSFALRTDIKHELDHAIYFTDAQYRECIKNKLDSLPSAKKTLVDKISKGQEDTYNFKNDRDLWYREMSAYAAEDLNYLQQTEFISPLTKEELKMFASTFSEIHSCSYKSIAYKQLREISKFPSKETSTGGR